MKLIVNVSGNLGGGGLQVALSLLRECVSFPEHEYHVFLGRAVGSRLNRERFPENFIFHDIPRLPKYRFQLRLGNLEKRIRPDAVFTVFGPAYWRPAAPHAEGYAIPHYLYPESPFFQNLSTAGRLRLVLLERFHRFCFRREADLWIAETDETVRRLKWFLNRKTVYTVSNTCSAGFLEPVPDLPPLLPEKRPDEFRVLVPAVPYPHKNLALLGKIADELRFRQAENVRMVVTLAERDYQRIFGSRYRDSIVNVGTVPPEKCPGLYHECDAVFLPSLLECFSGVWAEAMATGRPLLVSDLSFVRPVCGTAALYFDPLDAEDATDKILRLKNDPFLREKLIAAGTDRLQTFGTAVDRTEKTLSILSLPAFLNAKSRKS